MWIICIEQWCYSEKWCFARCQTEEEVEVMAEVALAGKVFVDYLSRLKQDRVRKKLVKQAKLA